MLTAPQEPCQNDGNPCVSALLGLWAMSKIKEISYGSPKTFRNLAQTTGFHHPLFLCKLEARTVLWRGTSNLRWEHSKSLGFLRFLAAPVGWGPWRLAERLAGSPESYG